MELIEDRVDFFVAKLLDERGFDERCTAFYVQQSNKIVLQECNKSVCFESCCNSILKEYNSKDEYNVSAPTIQMAMVWLMQRGIYISIEPIFSAFIREPMFFVVKAYTVNENNDVSCSKSYMYKCEYITIGISDVIRYTLEQTKSLKICSNYQ